MLMIQVVCTTVRTVCKIAAL